MLTTGCDLGLLTSHFECCTAGRERRTDPGARAWNVGDLHLCIRVPQLLAVFPPGGDKYPARRREERMDIPRLHLRSPRSWFHLCRPANRREPQVLEASPPGLTCPWLRPPPPRSLQTRLQHGHHVSAFPLSGSKPFDPEACPG